MDTAAIKTPIKTPETSCSRFQDTQATTNPATTTSSINTAYTERLLSALMNKKFDLTEAGRRKKIKENFRDLQLALRSSQ